MGWGVLLAPRVLAPIAGTAAHLGLRSRQGPGLLGRRWACLFTIRAAIRSAKGEAKHMVSNVPDPLSSSRAQLALGERVAAAEAEGARLRAPRCSPELPCHHALGSPRLGTPFSPGWVGPEEEHRARAPWQRHGWVPRHRDGDKNRPESWLGRLLTPALSHGPRRGASPAGAGTVAQICHSAWLPRLSPGPGAGRQGARSAPRPAAR